MAFYELNKIHARVHIIHETIRRSYAVVFYVQKRFVVRWFTCWLSILSRGKLIGVCTLVCHSKGKRTESKLLTFNECLIRSVDTMPRVPAVRTSIMYGWRGQRHEQRLYIRIQRRRRVGFNLFRETAQNERNYIRTFTYLNRRYTGTKFYVRTVHCIKPFEACM